jgi:hypothetical protein
MQLLKKESSSIPISMDPSPQRWNRCSLLPGCLVPMEVCGLSLLLDSLYRGASGLNYEKRKLWMDLE